MHAGIHTFSKNFICFSKVKILEEFSCIEQKSIGKTF